MTGFDLTLPRESQPEPDGRIPPIVTPWDNDPLMLPAFLGCVHWALSEKTIVAAFRAKTGNTWEPAKQSTEHQPEAAGREFFQQFSDFIADEYFGRPEPTP